jgi:hypothetical protein
MTLLSLASRCAEFGEPWRAADPVWGTNRDTALVEGAKLLAQKVRDLTFSQERQLLVAAYENWLGAPAPDREGVLVTLAEISDPDARRPAARMSGR